MSLLDFFRRPPSRRRYAMLLTKKLADRYPDQPVRYDEGGFRLLIGEDGSHIINLHNLYPEYCAADRHERGRQLERAVASARASGLPASFAEAGPRLMPALRGRGMMEYLRLLELGRESSGASRFLALPFSGDTVLMPMYDGEQSMHSFGSEQLEQWGVTVEDVLKAAMDNLRDATVERFMQVGRGVFAGDWADSYDSSRLLLPDLAHRVAGANPVAMIPNRGTLLLASANDVEAMRAMVALAQRVADEDTRPVSALLYRYEDGRPVGYLPEDADLRDALQRLDRQFRHGDYASQKETLDELHEKNGTDIFVASYKVMRDEASGIEYSLCIWTKDVDTLLPRAERVALSIHDDAGEQHDLLILPWDTVHAACGDLMTPVPEAFPERYRVSAFPDLAQLRKLAPSAG